MLITGDSNRTHQKAIKDIIIDPFGVIKKMVETVNSLECPAELLKICGTETGDPKETPHLIHHIWIGGKAKDAYRQGIRDAGRYCKKQQDSSQYSKAPATAIYWIYKDEEFSDLQYKSLLEEAQENNFIVFDIRHILKLALNEPDEQAHPERANILKEIARQVLYHINAREFINAADIFRVLELYYCGGLYLDHKYCREALETLFKENVFRSIGKNGFAMREGFTPEKKTTVILRNSKGSTNTQEIIRNWKSICAARYKRNSRGFASQYTSPCMLIYEAGNADNPKSNSKWISCGIDGYEDRDYWGNYQAKVNPKEIKEIDIKFNLFLSQYNSSLEIPENALPRITDWFEFYFL